MERMMRQAESHLSDERLDELDKMLREQIRLLNHRLTRSAIPEDGWEFGPTLDDAELKLALVTQLREMRTPSQVDDVMVDRACAAYRASYSDGTSLAGHQGMKAALEAALSQP